MSSIKLIAGVVALGFLVGCGPSNDKGTGASSGSGTSGTDQGVNTPTAQAPDNTGVNKRDQNEGALTPMDQGGSEADRTMSANIRKAVTKDEFSTDAKNIKIITQDGKVTLRGPVKDAQEKQAIESAVKSVAGVTTIQNQLEPKQQ